MATSETRLSTEGMVPAVNDLVAGLAIIGAYVTRYGVIAEGVAGEWWLLPLILTTDLLLPLLGGIWLLLVPTYSVYRRIVS